VASALSGQVQELLDKLLLLIAANDPVLNSRHGPEELQYLQELDQTQPGLLAWHVLPHLWPHINDGRLNCSISTYSLNRMVEYTDYSPLVWALGLEQPVAPATSSPLPAVPDPPLDDEGKAHLLFEIVDKLRCAKASAIRAQHLTYMWQVMEQLQQQQPDVLSRTDLPYQLWLLCDAFDRPNAFWDFFHALPTLQQAAGFMPRQLRVEHVQPVADGLMQSGLLPGWDVDDVWWLVCRLDNAVGGKDQVLQVFGTLALHAPYHPAFDHLGAMLLKFASNARRRRQLLHPTGTFADADLSPLAWSRKWSEWRVEDGVDIIREYYVSQLTCRLAAPEVVEWVTRLQLVLPPQQAHRLLLQLLQAPDSRKVLLSAGILQLYDLLLLQYTRPGWEAQQQAAALPPAAADVVLVSLRDASKSRAAASKVLAVWRHMCGTLEPAWCGGWLAAAAEAAQVAVKEGHIAPSLQQQQLEGLLDGVSIVSTVGSMQHQLLQQLSATGQQQVRVALRQLGLQAELVQVGAGGALMQ
jgi:hypothetical protein